MPGGTSPWAASLQGCVPCSTLRQHIKGRRAEAGRPPLLKEKEEEYLVDYVEKRRSVDGESVKVRDYRSTPRFLTM